MISFASKALLAFALLPGALGDLPPAETCLKAWAVDDGKEICAEPTTKYFGWSNGRYGTSGCKDCPSPTPCPECPKDPTSSPTLAPTPSPPSPVPLPQKCFGTSSKVSGDPHMSTFDGLKYDCQGEGEFHLLRSNSSEFEIQGRFVKFREDKRPTVTKSIVWNLDNGDPIMQVTVPDKAIDGKCIPYVHVDKTKIEKPLASQFITDGVQIKSVKKKRNQQGFIFYHHSSKVQVEILGKVSTLGFGCVINAHFCLPDSWERSKEPFSGLFGSSDNDRTNDWMNRDGTLAVVPKTKKERKFEQAYNWCTQWCVGDDKTSLFTYENGKDYDSYNNCSLPADMTTKECAVNPPDDVKNACGEDYACRVDGCIGGVGEAEDYLQTEIDLADTNCGKELFHVDFSDDADWSDWGTIEYIRDAQDKKINPFVLLTNKVNTLEHTFKVPAAAEYIGMELKFIESGKWEDERAHELKLVDEVYLKIGETEIDLGGFDHRISLKDTSTNEEFEGVLNGIIWSRHALTNRTENFGFNPSDQIGYDQMHKIKVTIPSDYYDQTGELKFGFRTDQNGAKELAGVDDIRLIAYGGSCNIAADPDVAGDVGSDFADGCGEQIFTEDFQDQNVSQWGGLTATEGTNHLLHLKDSDQIDITLHSDMVPTSTEALIVEFDVSMVNADTWQSACGETGCEGDKLELKIGDTLLELPSFPGVPGIELRKLYLPDTDITQFSDPTVDDFVLPTNGTTDGIEWRKSGQTAKSFHVEVHVPKEKFEGGDLPFTFKAILTAGIAVGLDEFNVVSFANGCLDREEKRGRRRLAEFLERRNSPRARLERMFSRALTATVKTDDCDCVCPAQSDVTPDTGSPQAPRVMQLYTKADKDCEPQGDSVGTVTMTQTKDGGVKFQYNIDSKYSTSATGVYVGEARFSNDGLNFHKPEDFPYRNQQSGTTEIVVDDTFVCDYYAAAWAEICGDFPTDPPTLSPTQSTPAPTPSSTPTPTQPSTSAPTGGSASGDPHVATWGGFKFDFQGGCDLVLLDNPNFHNGLGMKIHIRTKIETWWSYIETAVIRIGNETLQVTGGKDHKYTVNGVVGDINAKDFTFSQLGLKVHLKRASQKQLRVRIDLLNADAIGFEVYKDWVRVNAQMKDMKWKKFEGSVGLMGRYPHGETIGRDGTTVFTDMNAFGQEWQVREWEPMLFSTVVGPQHPTKCTIPSEVPVEEKRRRLGESMITREDAEIACSHIGRLGSRDECIFDVLQANDLDMAGSY